MNQAQAIAVGVSGGVLALAAFVGGGIYALFRRSRYDSDIAEDRFRGTLPSDVDSIQSRSPRIRNRREAIKYAAELAEAGAKLDDILLKQGVPISRIISLGERRNRKIRSIMDTAEGRSRRKSRRSSRRSSRGPFGSLPPLPSDMEPYKVIGQKR